MSAEKHSLSEEEVERLQEIVETRKGFGRQQDHSTSRQSTQEQQEVVFGELRRLTEDEGLTWVTANRIARDLDLDSHQVGKALTDLCKLNLAERMDGTVYKYRIHPLESR